MGKTTVTAALTAAVPVSTGASARVPMLKGGDGKDGKGIEML